MVRLGLALALALGLSSGCGYQVVRYENALPDVQRVAIQAFENDTFEPEIDRIFADSLQREFLRRGSLRLVDDPEVADLVVQGIISELNIISRSFSSISFALEYEVRMRLLVVVAQKDGTVLELDTNALQDSELYLASADVEVARTNREEALRRLSGVLASRIHDSIFEREIP
ncbi:MAG: LPS assembly lipoprotein LptE [Myxococcota bacterium]|nr:LPS assembly lipoprotein LptE [Myxococcota bacterium]